MATTNQRPTMAMRGQVRLRSLALLIFVSSLALFFSFVHMAGREPGVVLHVLALYIFIVRLCR